jgi:hypothetical protein
LLPATFESPETCLSALSLHPPSLFRFLEETPHVHIPVLFILSFQICHSKSGDINPAKIKSFVESYVMKMQQQRKCSKKVSPRPMAFNTARIGNVPGKVKKSPKQSSLKKKKL